MILQLILTGISIGGALYLLVSVLRVYVWSRGRSIPEFETELVRRDYNLSPERSLPRVSVIFAAKNEEQSIRQTVVGLLTQEYDNLEVVAVNDRSDDDTGKVLRELGREYGNLTVVTIDKLEENWLGKCHALHIGVAKATGEWLLFTDADVAFDTDVIRRSVKAAEQTQADHFVLFPQLRWVGHVEVALLTFFTMMLGIGFRFWDVESKSMRSWVGIGAFNMIRPDLYKRFDGHRALRMEVADDMKLGYLAKKHGGRSVVMYSDGIVSVRWREGALDIVRGLIRSGFAGMDFSLGRLLYSLTGLLVTGPIPIILLVCSQDPYIRVGSAVAMVMMLIALALTARSQRFPVWTAILYPITTVLFLVGVVGSAVMAWVRGGVMWRGTFYTIGELRKGSVR